jgi:hypothetical protein
MTEQEQNEALLKACGWEFKEAFEASFSDPSKQVSRGDKWHDSNGMLRRMPEIDLDFMHEAVAAHTEREGWTFQAMWWLRLQEVVQRTRRDLNREQIGYYIVEADVQQRREAFLRATRAWK